MACEQERKKGVQLDAMIAAARNGMKHAAEAEERERERET